MWWSAVGALNDLWEGLDTTGTNGQVRDHLKLHLVKAHNDALERAAVDAEAMATRFTANLPENISSPEYMILETTIKVLNDTAKRIRDMKSIF